MSIKTEITRLQNAKASIKTAIEGKGVTVPDGTKLDGMAALVDSISSGGGSSSETWVLNDSGLLTQNFTGLSFSSNGQTFTSIVSGRSTWMNHMRYDSVNVCDADLLTGEGIGWISKGWSDPKYRKLTFSTPPSGDLLTWLETNAVKQANDTAVQTDKALTITSNGTTEITPDAPYDALKKVDVTVNVASVSTVTINCAANDSFAFWLSPDGVFHKTSLNAGANTIIVTPYSPIGLYNMYGYRLDNMNNIVNSGSSVYILEDPNMYQYYYYRIYYATATTASATQPSD